METPISRSKRQWSTSPPRWLRRGPETFLDGFEQPHIMHVVFFDGRKERAARWSHICTGTRLLGKAGSPQPSGQDDVGGRASSRGERTSVAPVIHSSQMRIFCQSPRNLQKRKERILPSPHLVATPAERCHPAKCENTNALFWKLNLILGLKPVMNHCSMATRRSSDSGEHFINRQSPPDANVSVDFVVLTKQHCPLPSSSPHSPISR